MIAAVAAHVGAAEEAAAEEAAAVEAAAVVCVVPVVDIVVAVGPFAWVGFGEGFEELVVAVAVLGHIVEFDIAVRLTVFVDLVELSVVAEVQEDSFVDAALDSTVERQFDIAVVEGVGG